MRTGKPLQYVKTVRARGHVYHYFDTGRDVRGKRVFKRLPDKSDKGFGASYSAHLAARERRLNVAESPTVKFASNAYQRSPEFRKRAQATQNTYLIYLNVIEDQIGDAPVAEVRRADLRELMDKMQDTPGAANMLAGVARNIFKYALEREWIEVNPAASLTAFEMGDDTHEPWPENLIEEALGDASVRVPVALLYFTAQRIGDVCKMRWTDVRDGFVEVRQQKTGKMLDIRLHDRLRNILAETPKAAMTIIHGPKLRPARVPTLRLQLQKWAKDRGHHVVPHGLRKSAVNALLEAGCTMGETSAISGQSLQMVELYAKRRNNRRMGSAAILKWENAS